MGLRMLGPNRRTLIGLISVICMIQFINIAGLLGKTTQKEMLKQLPNEYDLMSKVKKTEAEVIERFAKRRSLVEKKCESSVLKRRSVFDVTGFTPAKFTICTVPKAACTVWLRLFTYLINKDSSNKTVTSISKYDVHFNFGKSRESYPFEGADKSYIMNSVRAMTSRDPYTRLWSAYIDKFFLPDFWNGRGRKIIRKTRPNATKSEKRCGYGVTFPEFIQYVLKSGHETDNWGFDFHWMPMTDICDPCLFKPKYILKQETFMSDIIHVVDRIGLLGDVKPMFEMNQDDFEIETEIDYNFGIYQKKNRSNCISKLTLANTIWEAMKLNGYLHPDEVFPSELVKEDIHASTLVGLVQSARKRKNMNKQAKKDIRKQALIDAYRQLSQTQLAALQQLYKVDFEMFDYDSSPPI